MTDWTFQRDAIGVFRFVRCSFDASSGVALLVYAFDDGPELVETITLPGAPFRLDPARAAAVEQALRLLHLIAGVSYYKAAVPGVIRIDAYGIDDMTAALLEGIYLNGLGEFAHRNGLELDGKIRFPALASSGSSGVSARNGVDDAATRHELHRHFGPPTGARAAASSAADADADADAGAASGRAAPEAAASALVGQDAAATAARRENAGPLGLRPHALVAIGGGKDSLVTIEALRALGVEQTVAWIGGSQLIAACAAHTGLPTLNIGRQLAPGLFEFNRQGAWNGHIPVTAINSAILALAAVVLGVDQVVFSNERSASVGSLIASADGGSREVNHQWSKGWAFEAAFAAQLRTHVAVDLRYYSLLRPLSELAVARQFARSDRYDAHFSSCNRNFHILGERPTSRWCGVCPKCHFVFLALAPFMPKPRLVGIVGRNLLDDAAQVAGFDALLEYGDHKPFECVGEGRESRAAMAALAALPEWREDAIVRRFAREIQPQLDAGALAIEPLLVPDGSGHGIPENLWARLRERFSA